MMRFNTAMTAGRQRITQRDVARVAKVSTATVSYVLSGRAGRSRAVSDETRGLVLAAVEQTGYRMNYNARSLRRRRTDVVCVVHTIPSTPSAEQIINQFGQAAARHDLTTIVLPIVDGDTAPAIAFLSGGWADAALMLPAHAMTPRQLRSLAGAGLDIVAFDESAAPRRFDVVRTHRLRARELVIDHLADRGLRRLAFFVHDLDELAEAPVGYVAALRRRGLALDRSLVFPVAGDRGGAHRVARDLLTAPDRPQAIVSTSDRAAVQAIYAAHEVGLQLPRDVAVAGSGDIEEGRVALPALTTVGPRENDLAAVFDRVFHRLSHTEPLPGRALDLPWVLTERGST